MTVTPLRPSAPAHAVPDAGQEPGPVTVQDLPVPDVDVLVARTSALLADGVPLSLLLDLACQDGPPSDELWADEAPEMHWLLPGAAADAFEHHWDRTA